MRNQLKSLRGHNIAVRVNKNNNFLVVYLLHIKIVANFYFIYLSLKPQNIVG